jgi:hypothetical protein
MRKDYYVLLTGSKNNAGDFLIKYRAKQLLSHFRSDREFVDLDRWQPFGNKELELVNNSKALILTGGPSLQFSMRPKVYPMVDNLNDIKVPIILMGIGYKDQNGTWENTSKYALSEETLELLKRIENSGYASGVRDYHTLNVLLNKGFKNFIMSGCPALYDIGLIDAPIADKVEINKVAFSLGVSYLDNNALFDSMTAVIASLKEYFREKDFIVIFHHKINRDHPTQERMIKWLEFMNISYQDISGSEDGLIKVYSGSDIHIGYRVHAHIFMSGISRPSILLNEDGRGKALSSFIGGIDLDCYKLPESTPMNKLLMKFNLKDKMVPVSNLEKDLVQNLNYEITGDYPRIRMVRNNIRHYFNIMRKFIEQLP